MTFEHSSGSPHHFLSRLAGGWTGTSKLWFEPDELADHSPVVGNIQLILDGRFALYLYQGSVQGEPQHGMFTFGYNTLSDRYEASWVDSWHNNTAIMFCVGTSMEDGFSVLGSYDAGGEPWGWRTTVDLRDDDHLVLTAFNVPPGKHEEKAIETLYQRKT